MKYTNLTQAQEWFYVQKSFNPEKPIVNRIVVWASSEEGDVVGLIAEGYADKQTRRKGLPLVPSQGSGKYKHYSELDEKEKAAIKE